MDRVSFIRHLESFLPFNEQEERDREVILNLLQVSDDELITRANPAHLTASAWIVNPKRDKILMAYHNIYRAWSWLGGHLDGEWDAAKVALREVLEESGISAKLLGSELFSCEILTVNGHEKRGVYVPSHLHLNVTYLMEADDTVPLSVKPDENSAVQWFSINKAPLASCEVWMRTRIYQKLNARLEQL